MRMRKDSALVLLTIMRVTVLFTLADISHGRYTKFVEMR